MAFITNAITGYVDKAVSGAVATAGGFAGDVVGGVGGSINNVGRAVENSIRYYGDGTRDYGNAIKDYTKAGGSRDATAANPLGLPQNHIGGATTLGFRGAPQKSAPKQQKAVARPTGSAAARPAGKPKTGPVVRSTPKSAPAARSGAAGGGAKRNIVNKESKPPGRGGLKPAAPASKSASSMPKSGAGTSGKVRISAESRPKK